MIRTNITAFCSVFIIYMLLTLNTIPLIMHIKKRKYCWKFRNFGYFNEKYLKFTVINQLIKQSIKKGFHLCRSYESTSYMFYIHQLGSAFQMLKSALTERSHLNNILFWMFRLWFSCIAQYFWRVDKWGWQRQNSGRLEQNKKTENAILDILELQ